MIENCGKNSNGTMYARTHNYELIKIVCGVDDAMRDECY